MVNKLSIERRPRGFFARESVRRLDWGRSQTGPVRRPDLWRKEKSSTTTSRDELAPGRSPFEVSSWTMCARVRGVIFHPALQHWGSPPFFFFFEKPGSQAQRFDARRFRGGTMSFGSAFSSRKREHHITEWIRSRRSDRTAGEAPEATFWCRRKDVERNKGQVERVVLYPKTTMSLEEPTISVARLKNDSRAPGSPKAQGLCYATR